MLLQSDAIVSMREANQNFSAVAKMADEKNAVVITRQNKPAYAVIRFDTLEKEVSSDETLQLLSADTAKKLGGQIIAEYHDVFEELAK